MLTGREVQAKASRHAREVFMNQTAPTRPTVSQRTAAQRRYLSERLGTEQQRREALSQIRMGRRAAAAAALSANTWRQNASIWGCVLSQLSNFASNRNAALPLVHNAP